MSVPRTTTVPEPIVSVITDETVRTVNLNIEASASIFDAVEGAFVLPVCAVVHVYIEDGEQQVEATVYARSLKKDGTPHQGRSTHIISNPEYEAAIIAAVVAS